MLKKFIRIITKLGSSTRSQQDNAIPSVEEGGDQQQFEYSNSDVGATISSGDRSSLHLSSQDSISRTSSNNSSDTGYLRCLEDFVRGQEIVNSTTPSNSPRACSDLETPDRHNNSRS
jgi:hypothetical protein